MKTNKHPILQFLFLKKEKRKCLPTYPLSQPLGRVWANQNIFNCGLVRHLYWRLYIYFKFSTNFNKFSKIFHHIYFMSETYIMSKSWSQSKFGQYLAWKLFPILHQLFRVHPLQAYQAVLSDLFICFCQKKKYDRFKEQRIRGPKQSFFYFQDINLCKSISIALKLYHNVYYHKQKVLGVMVLKRFRN